MRHILIIPVEIAAVLLAIRATDHQSRAAQIVVVAIVAVLAGVVTGMLGRVGTRRAASRSVRHTRPYPAASRSAGRRSR